MVAVCEQGYWMLTVSYQVESSGAGCMRCLTIWTPHWVPISCHGFSASFFVETYLMHWAHGIKDTDALDVVGYYYLFNSLAVMIHYNQRGYSRGLKQTLKSEED